MCFITHLTIPWDCIPTPPRDEGRIDGICGFVGTEVEFDDETEGFFGRGVRANVGRGDGMKGVSSEYSTGQFMRNAHIVQNLGP